jgi:hypothetical protein
VNGEAIGAEAIAAAALRTLASEYGGPRPAGTATAREARRGATPAHVTRP